MYVPSSFAVEDQTKLWQFLDEYPFALLLTAAQGELMASHLPLLVEHRGTTGVLRGHVAKANPHWKQFNSQTDALVVFQGPHGYISPQWYVQRPAVPTWNYTAVHVYGRPRVIDDRAESRRLLNDLTERFESGPGDPLTDAMRTALEASIVAFEMPIDRWEGKFKLSQNRSADDRASVIEHLLGSSRSDAQALGQLMQREPSGQGG